jgi:iron complex transport system substrate-binding protein
MKKSLLRSFLLVTVTVIAALLAGCSPAAPVETNVPAASTGKISLTDGLKRTVELDRPAQTVVSLAPSNSEILYAVGAGKQVIGRDDLSDYPAEVKDVQSVGGSMSKYNLEEITKLKPDLVLAAEINTPELVKSIEDLGIKVYYLSNPTDLEGMYANLLTVGKLTGHVADAQALVDSLKTRVDAVAQSAGTDSAKPRVFYELDGTDPSKPWTPGKGTFVDLLITMAGGINVAAPAGDGWIQISQEELLVQNPDIILLGDGAYGVTPESVQQRTGWQDIGAVKNKAIFVFDDNLTSRPGPRLVDGLETLAKILHPEK